ncbi:molybdopterin-dependent oxidoreductase [Roseovarius nubinhibens]|uniref:molybdopterin-dependent oxidoreductase n=1 Tax=Roseovarius nubinhibens TaxID=314263 RepID=UPI001C092418|nr:molybdopterin-dependent oxidoreductase [Roseovarius nubinhibens]MBU2999637.1 molybdopterin-dependent oxidoreductase [Roseovarius nubinhibens]
MSDRQTRTTTSHWGAFDVTTEGGRIVDVAPFAADPDPSPIPNILPQAVHHANRVLRPSVRRGWLEGRRRDGRGTDDYVELPWDEALDLAAEELRRVIDAHGNEAIFGGSYGWASAGRFHHALSQVHRFLNCIGGYVKSFGSYSTGAAQAIMPHVLGENFLKLTYGYQNSWPTIRDHTETLVMFGGINPKNSQVNMGGVTRHQTRGWCEGFIAQGMKLVLVAPQRGDGPEGSDWMPVVPGTDTALMLALAHVLETEGLADQDFLARCASGYERFKPYLLGESDGVAKTPDWAAPICGIAADEIRALARRMAGTRTLITVSWSLQRQRFGEQPYWMAAVLAAMLGQIGLPGGGVGYGYGAIGGVGVAAKRLRGLALPQGENPVADVIPVARIADMLLNPGAPYQFNGEDRTYPDIKLVYWCGGNPFHHHQDLNRLDRAWAAPETIIVHEPWWTPTAKRADIVFPSTTPYEREDIARANMDEYLFAMPQLIAPLGEARNDYDIFAGLAARLGQGEAFTEGRAVEGWLRHLYAEFVEMSREDGIEMPDYDRLRKENWVKLPIAGDEHAISPFEAFRADPAAAPLKTPSGKVEIFSERIAGFGYEDCPGHPTWMPPEEWLGSETRGEMLHLVSPQPGDKLHSQLEAALQDVEGARPERVLIHPRDAAARGIADGQIVEMVNARGACLARAEVSEDIRPGVVSLPTGAWLDGAPGAVSRTGNPNVLTRDIGTSRLGQGSSAHTTLVAVRPAG